MRVNRSSRPSRRCGAPRSAGRTAPTRIGLAFCGMTAVVLFPVLAGLADGLALESSATRSRFAPTTRVPRSPCPTGIQRMRPGTVAAGFALQAGFHDIPVGKAASDDRAHGCGRSGGTEDGAEVPERAGRTSRRRSGHRRAGCSARPAAATATNCATASASSPSTRSAAILPLPRARPFSIALSTSAFGGRSSSRFGPTLATASAAASVWQLRQCWPNSSRPCSCSGGELVHAACGIDLRSLSRRSRLAGTATPRTQRARARTHDRAAAPARGSRLALAARRSGPPLIARKNAPSPRSTKSEHEARGRP